MQLLKQIIDSLPEVNRVETTLQLPRGTMVNCGGHWGLASTFLDPRNEAEINQAALSNMEAKQLARYALSPNLKEASWGMAAVNALLQPTRLTLRPLNASALVAKLGRGKRVTSIGNFPFLERLRGIFRQLTIIDLPPWQGKEGVEQACGVLPQTEIAAITGSSFINHTAESLLRLCPQAYVIVLGPTTPLTPLLFKSGVNAICGTVVTDPHRACFDIKQGIGFRRAAGLSFVTALKEMPDS